MSRHALKIGTRLRSYVREVCFELFSESCTQSESTSRSVEGRAFHASGRTHARTRKYDVSVAGTPCCRQSETTLKYTIIRTLKTICNSVLSFEGHNTTGGSQYPWLSLCNTQCQSLFPIML